MSDTYTQTSISCDGALRVLQRALDRAREQNLAVCAAVVGPRGELKAFANMDGAPVVAVEACRAKACTALMGLGSGELAQALDGQWGLLASFAAMPDFTLMGGGLPLMQDGQIIGAIGVGGALAEQDIAIAEWAREGLA